MKIITFIICNMFIYTSLCMQESTPQSFSREQLIKSAIGHSLEERDYYIERRDGTGELFKGMPFCKKNRDTLIPGVRK